MRTRISLAPSENVREDAVQTVKLLAYSGLRSALNIKRKCLLRTSRSKKSLITKSKKDKKLRTKGQNMMRRRLPNYCEIYVKTHRSPFDSISNRIRANFALMVRKINKYLRKIY